MLARMLLSLFLLTTLICPTAQAAKITAVEPLLHSDVRLMVFSPHPDDESLGAGGLIQRVLSLGGQVKVVFMTNGDGFPEGIQTEDHISHPSAADYRRYGAERKQEALKAISQLGLKPSDAVFLGFPDGGLYALLWKYRSQAHPYTSPFTREDRPIQASFILPHSEYAGVALRKEIARLISDFKPTIVVEPPPEDEHPDHSSTYHFVKAALRAAALKQDRPVILTYLVHFGQWPLGAGAGKGTRLNPPRGYTDARAEWVSFALKPEETATKTKAILDYHSQMLVMGSYLLSFSRGNELYTVDHQETGGTLIR